MVWRHLHITETGCPAGELYKEPQSSAYRAKPGRAFALQVYDQIQGENYSLRSTPGIFVHALAASLGVLTGCSFESFC